MSLPMRPYYLSKWSCQFHGKYSARTAQPVSADRPVICPECVPTLEGQIKGMTTQSLPYVSKPRIPQTRSIDKTFSKKARPKRGTNGW